MLPLRPSLSKRRLAKASDLDRVFHGCWVRDAGIPTVPQQPEAAKGTVFISLEDETGHVQLIVWRSLKEQQRPEVLRVRLLAGQGQRQREGEGEGEVKNLIAYEVGDLTPLLGRLSAVSRDFHWGEVAAHETHKRWTARGRRRSVRQCDAVARHHRCHFSGIGRPARTKDTCDVAEIGWPDRRRRENHDGASRNLTLIAEVVHAAARREAVVAGP